MKTWLSVYLFNEDLWGDEILLSVSKFLVKLQKNQQISQYFFLRYNDGISGKHLRLRIKGEKKLLDSHIKNKIIEYFSQYYLKRYIQSTTEDKKLLLDKIKRDYIQFFDYHPEYERYGGKIGMNIAEAQFWASSKAISKIVSRNSKMIYENKIGVAILIHLIFVHSLGLDVQEMQNFYETLSRRVFFLSSDLIIGESTNKRDQTKYRNSIFLSFETSFKKQKHFLVKYHEQIIDSINDNFKNLPLWSKEWNEDMGVICDKLKQAYRSKKLIIPDNFFSVEKNRPLWFLYESYAHMSNNRIGIKLFDEAFLYYVISNSLKFSRFNLV